MSVDRNLDRHQLRLQLRRYRQEAGLSQREVAKALGWSSSKIYRIEAGTSPVSEADLTRLLDEYQDAPGEERAVLLALVRSAPRPTSAKFRDSVPASVRRYLDYEAAAEQIWNFEPMFVPGLLQTPGYTRALLSGVGLRPAGAESIESAVQLRRFRQEILKRSQPAQLHALIDESALIRQVGGRDVMAQQLEHLWAMNERPNVSVGIVPLTVGVYTAMRSPFVVMRFSGDSHLGLLFIEDPVTEVVTVEGDDGSTGETAAYHSAFEEVWGRALTGIEATHRLKAAWQEARDAS
jgi:transcriptional regulator with XRE-family HTH domain